MLLAPAGPSLPLDLFKVTDSYTLFAFIESAPFTFFGGGWKEVVFVWSGLWVAVESPWGSWGVLRRGE